MEDPIQAAFDDLSMQKQPIDEVLSTSPETNHSLTESTLDCLKFAATYSQKLANPEGTWSGESRCQASLTLEYVLLRQALGLDLDADREALCRYLFADQKEDGSWGIAPDGYPGDVSITTEAYLALKILGVPSDHSAMHKARTFVIGKGGVAKVRIFTRIFLAQYGLFPWAAVPQLPTELILLPRQSPINIYKLSSWARAFMIPLCIIRHHEPIYSLPNGTSANNDFLDELWLNPSDKMVPYASSLWQLWNEDVVSLSFAVIDKALKFIGRRLGPLRTYSKRQCLEWILGHQEQCGVIQGNFPPLHFSILALVLEGYTIEDSPVSRGLDAVEKMAWQDNRGKRMQACLSTLWDTALMTIGLCDSMQLLDSPYIKRAISWLKSKQHVGPNGDWRINNPELAPGGFSFGPYDSWYPDLDDTAVVIMALLKQDPASITSSTVTRAAEWLLGMQNKDGGFGAFDSNNDALFLNKIPFSDMDALCDPSWSDVTGRVLEAFGMLLSSPHRNQMQLNLLSRIKVSSIRAIEFISSQQEKQTGAWYGRWGCNYIYGTSGALCGLSSFTGCTSKQFLNGHTHENKGPLDPSQEGYFTSKLAQSLVPPGLSFLKSSQNPDGGWGESLETYRRPELAGKGESTPSQTAWALMGLIAYLPPEDESIIKGVKYLVTTQVGMDEGGKSWKENMHTGVGFPNFYFLGYDYYRHYFPMMALGRYAKAVMEKTDRG